MNTEKQAPTPMAKWLCSLSAAFLGALGVAAIVTETHSGYARFKGHVTLLGDQAVSMGFVLLCMALLPLVVWVPRRWIGRVLVGWWLLLMVTIFQGIFRPF
jgi:Ca2+/Na+ antiporter